MKLTAFKIKNFRSILDTGWCNLSSDNITGLIGQNEAGKTSVLDALYSFYTQEVNENDLRSDATLPEICCSFQLNKNDLSKIQSEKILHKKIESLLKEKGWRVNLKVAWTDADSPLIDFEEEDIKKLFDEIEVRKLETNVANIDSNEVDVNKTKAAEVLDQIKELVTEQFISKAEFSAGIINNMPEFIYFQDDSSLLPNMIDIEDIQAKKPTTQGFRGALNFLKIAKLDVNNLGKSDLRMEENQIAQANKEITKDFQSFWQQKIGKSSKIRLECDLKRHDSNVSAKAGKPYLVFWIADGAEKLYPEQRSKGVIWFLSFYLQLRASQLGATDRGAIYLLDEPGGSLHAKAQKDVLRLFEDIKENIQIIYTTHSPYLIEQSTLYRLMAVQRANDEDEKSPTLVLNINFLGTASSETLSPVYTAMGIDFSHQNVIQKNNNVILEELSAFYYFKAFWMLANSSKKAHFLPANGASTISQLVYLFLGWGLNFLVVVDDDNAGRRTFNDLKKNLYQDDAKEADMTLLKIKECDGVEDIFSKKDFKKYVMRDMEIDLSVKNSAYIKSAGTSKIISAVNFMLDVQNKKISIDNLDKETQSNINGLVKKIEERLS